MRKLIENPIYMTYDEMESNFMGKWILIANCKYGKNRRFIGGIPVAIADSQFEGQSDGFYDKFKAPEYAPRTDEDFNYDNIPDIAGIYEIPSLMGDENANDD